MINSRMLFGPFGISIAAIVVIILAVVVPIPRVLGVMRATGVSEDENASRMNELIAQSNDRLDQDRDRFMGRSAFFTPPRPYVPPPVRDETPTGPPPIQPAPTSYGGQLKPYAIIGDEVWFATSETSGSPSIVRIGNSTGDIRLIAINAPWTVRVAWRAPNSEEGEYDLRVFSSTDGSGFRPVSPDNSSGSSSSSSSSLPPGMRPAPNAPPASTDGDAVNEREVEDVPSTSDDQESRS